MGPESTPSTTNQENVMDAEHVSDDHGFCLRGLISARLWAKHFAG